MKKKIRVHEKSERESLGILEETVRLFFILKKKIRVREKREREREREFWVSVFDLLISVSFSVLNIASFFFGSIVSPFNCILTH